MTAMRTSLSLIDSILTISGQCSARRRRALPEIFGLERIGAIATLRRRSAADEKLLLLRRRQHLLTGGRQLGVVLGEAGDDPPAAGLRAFAEFSIVAHAGVALGRGHLLRH